MCRPRRCRRDRRVVVILVAVAITVIGIFVAAPVVGVVGAFWGELESEAVECRREDEEGVEARRVVLERGPRGGHEPRRVVVFLRGTI